MIELIEAQSKQLVQTVKNYVHSQKNQWNQLPWWALEADGRRGYGGDLKLIYQNNQLPLQDDRFGIGSHYFGFIDLTKGRLIDSIKWNNDWVMADWKVLMLAGLPDLLNAETHLHRIQAQARSHISYSEEESQKRARWRDQQRKRFNVTKPAAA